MSALEWHYEPDGGLHLPRLGLWLDARRPITGSERVFVNHAHADHTAAHREVILTAATARFLRARLGGERLEHVLEFGQPGEFAGPEAPYRLTLWPAGHILGSAMVRIEAGGESLLYTGDFKLRPGRAAEPCQPAAADVLVMETTFGRPEFQFPPADEVMTGVIRFCWETLGEGQTALLLAYSLGKSQEVLRRLADAGLPLVLHEETWRMTQVYRELGMTFPPCAPLDSVNVPGAVVLAPPSAQRAALLRRLGPARTAVLTGWAVNPPCRFQHGADAAFPLSDHADFSDLLQLVERVNPRRVFTLHGFAADFAAALRARGYDARALSQTEQLTLALENPDEPPARRATLSHAEYRPRATRQLLAAANAHAPAPRDPREPASPEAPNEDTPFAVFAAACAAIAETGARLEKVTRLAACLRELPAAWLPRAVVWFSGLPFAPPENKTLQVGGAALRRAVCAVAGVEETAFRQAYLRHGDTGETAAELCRGRLPQSPPLRLGDVARLFDALHAASGPTAKVPLLEACFARCSAAELKYLVKIITGDLRIGLQEGLIEEALAAAYGAETEMVRRAHLLLGHLGEAAELARRGELDRANLVLFRPVKLMLASPEPSAVAVWGRIMTQFAPPPGSPPVAWVEDKYDGIRCQLHKQGGRVALFTRDLKDVTATFPEIAEAARTLPADVILDGEILAMRGEEVLPFAELQKRLGRREGDLFLGAQIPVRLLAFDLLWCDGEPVLDAPLRARRARLEALGPWPPALGLARVTRAASIEDLEAAFLAARRRCNEGLLIKDPASPYTPGRRGLAWLKLKKALATLDCVVVAAEYGHGKRRAVLSVYTFAVRDERTGALRTLGKAYSGLTDEEIARLTDHFLARVIRQRGRLLEVTPDVVLEIAFDRIQPGPRHTSGLALRFPRIARLRPDKTVADIDTVATARRLAGLSDPPAETADNHASTLRPE